MTISEHSPIDDLLVVCLHFAEEVDVKTSVMFGSITVVAVSVLTFIGLKSCVAHDDRIESLLKYRDDGAVQTMCIQTYGLIPQSGGR